jgi:Protein of unknown function (DUF2490)
VNRVTRGVPPIRRLLRVLALLFACAALGGPASADDPWEFWPEGQLYVELNPRTRVFLDSAYAKGKESDELALDAAACFDISFLPIGPKRRRSMRAEDWQRNRYFWARVGYDRVFKITDAEGRSVAENRGILSLSGKVQLPGNVWLENRARVDLRWIGAEYSTRYRWRMEATREFAVAGHAIVPYLNVEWFYDTRYDGWARTLYQAGGEVTVNKHWRFELNLSQQTDTLPETSRLNAFSVVLKGYY